MEAIKNNKEVLLSVRDLEVTFGSKRNPFKAVKGVNQRRNNNI